MVGIKDALAAAAAFKAALNGDVVSPETIHERDAICARCPMRRFKQRGMTPVSKLLGQLANRHRVPKSIANYSCGVCGCSLMLLIPAQSKDLHIDSPEEAKKRPGSCWVPAAKGIVSS